VDGLGLFRLTFVGYARHPEGGDNRARLRNVLRRFWIKGVNPNPNPYPLYLEPNSGVNPFILRVNPLTRING